MSRNVGNKPILHDNLPVVHSLSNEEMFWEMQGEGEDDDQSLT